MQYICPKSQAARDNARAARHQAKQGAVTSPALGEDDKDDEDSPAHGTSRADSSQPPTVPLPPAAACSQSPAATATTPKRTATSPLESSPKRFELPVWDPNTSSPGVLRGSLQDVSLDVDIPQDVSFRECPQDVTLGEIIHNHGAKEDDHEDSDWEDLPSEDDGYNDDEDSVENELDEHYEDR